MNDPVMEAVGRALELSNKEYGEPLSEGESIMAVFNDCTIGIGIEYGKLKVDVQLGKPLMINENVFPEEG